MEIIVPKTLTDYVSDADLQKKFPFYDIIPQSQESQLEFRVDLQKRWCVTKKTQRDAWKMCARDLLFYINGFVWTYDPRIVDEGLDPKVPFNTYDYQDDAFYTMSNALGRSDLVMRKSRDMGASWMCCVLFEHSWHFSERRVSYMMISRIGELVDKGEDPDPDTLFAKIDFVHEHLPPWLRCPTARVEMKFTNKRTKSLISGARTTGEAGRGGRRTAFFIDEHNAFDTKDGYSVMAATRDNTRCRILNGTAQGVGSAFHAICNSPEWNKIVMFWWQHPLKNEMLYYDEDGKKRSPWYDNECKRAANEQEIAAELDGDFHAAEYNFYGPKLLDNIIKEYCVDPVMVGDLLYDPLTARPKHFDEEPEGNLRIWAYLKNGRPADGPYSMGIDISQGTGASNSCASIFHVITGEKVAEYANPRIDPAEFAKQAVALAIFFGGDEHDCHMIWEANGPGQHFGAEVVALGYRNIYYKTNEDKISPKAGDIPGWWATKKTRQALHQEYRDALKTGRVINRSAIAIEECRQYKHTDGDVVHVTAQNMLDPTGARDNHGDRVVADALGAKGVKVAQIIRPERKIVPAMSYQWRKDYYERHQRRKVLW